MGKGRRCRIGRRACRRELNTVDLFCGAGGATTGLELALSRLKMCHRGIAINHWSVAVDTMRKNHPFVDTKQMSIEEAVPSKLVPGKIVDLLWASPSCFTAGHLVTTMRGQVPIESVVVGDMVLTHKGRWRKVVRKQHRFSPCTVIAKGAGHYGINCTASHRFWMRASSLEYIGKGRHAVRTYDDPQWMRIDRAVSNEALWCTPVKIEPLPIPELPEPLATLKDPWWVIGRWIGDGCLGSGRHFDTSICTPHDEEEVLEEALSGGSRKWAKFVKRTVTNYTLSDRETMEWLEGHFGRYSHGKSIPSWCLTMPEENRRSLWEGYMSADGYDRQRRHQANTVSKQLAISLRMLGEGLGHRIGMTHEHRPTYRIEGRSGKARDQYRLHFNGALSDERSKESFAEDGMAWSRVKWVTEGPKNQTVYNIEVEEDHSYVLDGIVVKNCTHHSRAKGGKPRDDQQRAQPELILTWLDQLFVRRIIVENVPEFVDWGPLNLDGTPSKRGKGKCFQKWVRSIEARNYIVEWRIVNCADYGDATSRRRFFLKAVKRGCGTIRWPEPTHTENPQPDLFGRELKKWRGVRECLDLSDMGTSIFNRERPLSKNTMRRIAVGMRKYNGLDFLMDMLGSDGGDDSRVHPLTSPLPTQHSGGNRCAVVRPFLVRMNRNCNAESIDAPLSTTTTKEHHALCTPFIVKLNNHNDAEDVEKPLTSVLAGGQHHALCQPIILDHFKNGEAQSVDEPIGAQTTHDRYSVVQPFIMNNNENNVPRPLDKPLVTLTTGNHAYLCTPLVLGQHGGAECRPIDKPCPTIATAGAIRVATPIIYNEAVGLPQLPDGRFIDIRLRMLKPSELAAAHSFPKDYVLTGNRSEQVKQIGNSVPVLTAAAMCSADIEPLGRAA